MVLKAYLDVLMDVLPPTVHVLRGEICGDLNELVAKNQTSKGSIKQLSVGTLSDHFEGEGIGGSVGLESDRVSSVGLLTGEVDRWLVPSTKSHEQFSHQLTHPES